VCSALKIWILVQIIDVVRLTQSLRERRAQHVVFLGSGLSLELALAARMVSLSSVIYKGMLGIPGQAGRERKGS
jgi:hypothetical protein